jgi:uncharacterized membrane protein YidH (DUF202 family)
LIFVFFIYPTLLLFGTAIYKWRDDKWQVKGLFVPAVLSITSLGVLAFLILLSIFVDPWQVGTTLILLYTLGMSVTLLAPIFSSRFPTMRKRFPYAPHAMIALAIALCIGFTGGFASEANSRSNQLSVHLVLSHKQLLIVIINE